MPEAASTEVVLGAPIHLMTCFRLTRLGSLDPTCRLDAQGMIQGVQTPKGPAVLVIRALDLSPRGLAARFSVTGHGPGADHLVGRADRLLGRDDDPAAFVPRCAPTRSLVRQARGLRLVRAASPAELLIALVFQQRVAWRDAARTYLTLVKRHGRPAPGRFGVWLPPAPKTWSRVPLTEFSALDIDRRRADTVRRVAQIAGHLDAFFDVPYEEVRRKLSSVAGVGPWTTEGFLGFALGDPDALQTGDYDLPHRVAKVFTGAERSDDEAMIRTLEPYRGQRFRIVRMIHESSLKLTRFGPRRGSGRPRRERR